MALPGPNDAGRSWPPSIWDPVAHDQRLWSAWFSGKADELAWAYLNLGANSQIGRAFFRTTGERNVRIPRPGQYRGGLLGSVDRTFWGTSPSAGEKRSKIHVPAAGDISSMSADLLFAKRPRFDSAEGESTAQQWCEQRFDDDLHASLLEAAELCSGLGGVYLRACWDTDISDKPFLDLVHADAAVPTFRNGKLISVIFWRVLYDGDGEVHRHLEEHDLLANSIQHAVYVGSQAEIGLAVDIASYPELAPVAAVLDDNGRLNLPDLHTDFASAARDVSTVTYVPNMRPNRYWRHLHHAASLGRSDYGGVEPLMDSLDETYSSWMRDIRLAKSRLLVPPSYLDDLGPGRGAIMDVDRELFVPLNLLAGSADATSINANQFAIRWQEHSQTMTDTLNAILRGAGYSPQTFGDAPTAAMTAAEIESREKRTLLTRAKKLNYWRPALANSMYTLMWLDKLVFGRDNLVPERPDITFPEAVLPSAQELGQTVVAFNTAQAASKQTMVAMLHPDWTPQQVQEEVERIRDEAAFDILGRARVMLQAPQDSEATIGQEVQEIEHDITVAPSNSTARDPEGALQG